MRFFLKMSEALDFGKLFVTEEEVPEYKEGCLICLNDGRDLPVTSCCGKMVHERCLSNWLEVCTSRSCPHCREGMITVSLKKKTERGFDPRTFGL